MKYVRIKLGICVDLYADLEKLHKPQWYQFDERIFALADDDFVYLAIRYPTFTRRITTYSNIDEYKADRETGFSRV